MSDYSTLQQKMDLARRNFLDIAGNKDGSISWDDSEKIIKSIFLHTSSKKMTNLLSDADGDGTHIIRYEPFMKIIEHLLNKEFNKEDSSDDETDVQPNLVDYAKAIDSVVKEHGFVTEEKVHELKKQFNINL